jgi:hypothetical protein
MKDNLQVSLFHDTALLIIIILGSTLTTAALAAAFYSLFR